MQDYKLPAGLRDNFGPQATQKESVRHYLTGLFQRHHYTLIETSLLEYRDVFGPYELQAESLYRILEADGQDLVLRPDLTLPIARFLVTTNVSLPTSFAYVGEQFRRTRQLTGLYNQSTQAGIELIGFQSRRAELECLTVISELNRDLFNGRLLVELGQARLADLVLADLPASERQKEAIKAALFNKNVPDYEAAIAPFKRERHYPFLAEWTWLFGKADVVEKMVAPLWVNPAAREAMQEVLDLAKLVAQLGDQELLVDFSTAAPQAYYTGVTFKAYADKTSTYLVSGGRYDNLLANFQEKSEPAIGLGIDVTLIAQLLERSAPRDQAKPTLVFCQLADWPTFAKRYGGDPAYEACLADSLVAARTQAAATGQQLKVMNEEGDLIDA